MTTQLDHAVLFDVRYPDGRRESIHVTQARVLLGAASHCDVRILSDGIAQEHVLITRIGDEIVLEPRTLEPAPTIDDQPIVAATKVRGGVLRLAGVAVHIVPMLPALGAAGAAPARSWRYALLGIGLLAGIVMLAMGRRAQDEAPSAPSATKLWDPSEARCAEPEQERDRARALAMEKRDLAFAKRERRAFRVQEGVSAVSLFEEAAACFRAAGDVEAASAQASSAKALRAKIDEEYHAHQIRLEHALSIGDDAATGLEVRVLLNLTERRDDDYVEWLRIVGRRTEMKLAAGDSNKKEGFRP